MKIYQDYNLHIDFDIDSKQLCGGLDIVPITAVSFFHADEYNA